MAEINEFLANEVIVEQKLVTYRYVSRALKVNVNVAKRALFEFYTSQNAKKAGLLHATYLLYGTKPEPESSQTVTKPAEEKNGDSNGSAGDDVDMDGEAPQPRVSETVPIGVITLVSEADLEAALAKYATLESIHIYSISVEPTTDLQLLSDSSRRLRELRGAAPATAEALKAYGTVPNSHVRYRQRKGQAPVLTKPAAAAPSVTPTSVFGSSKPAKSLPLNSKEDTKAKPAVKPASKPAASSDAPGPNSIWNKVAKPAAVPAAAPAATSASSSAAASPAAMPTAPAPPKKAAGGIMQAFAKGATMPKPTKKKEVVKAAPAEEDTAMALSDDGGDDGDDDDILPKAQQVAGGKSREERMQALRKMMEDDDDDDEDDEDAPKNEDDREDTPMEDVQEPVPQAAAPAAKDGPSEILSASSGGGRRRGKKRVMKKKRIEDENGYLVTIEEASWESFSEDEEPPKAAPAPAAAPAATAAAASSAPTASTAASAQAKPKKAPPKKGQGNIMSFFGKK